MKRERISRGEQLALEFDELMEKHPEVYEHFDRLCRAALEKGYTRWSADAVFHLLRWELGLRPGAKGGPRLNDHATSAMARLWLERNPKHAGFFELRKTRLEREAPMFAGRESA